MVNEPVKQGHIKLVRLAQEGRIAAGDLIETYTLGVCAVVAIESTHTISVRAADGQHYRLTGLFFPNARMVDSGATA